MFGEEKKNENISIGNMIADALGNMALAARPDNPIFTRISVHRHWPV